MIPPVYLSRDSDFHAVFPLYAQDEDTTWVVPNLRLEHGPDGDLDRLQSVGLFDWRRRGEGGELDAALLASFAWGGESTHARVFPLFSVSQSPGHQSTWVGPFNHARGRTLARDCLLPVYCDIRQGDDHRRFIGPWYASDTPTSASRGIVGLYGSSDRVLPSGNRVGTERACSLKQRTELHIGVA